MNKEMIKFNDEKNTILNAEIINGFRITKDKPKKKCFDHGFSIDLIVGKIQCQIISLNYIIPGTSVKYGKSLNLIHVRDWEDLDYENTEKLFHKDVEILNKLFGHQELELMQIEVN